MEYIDYQNILKNLKYALNVIYSQRFVFVLDNDYRFNKDFDFIIDSIESLINKVKESK